MFRSPIAAHAAVEQGRAMRQRLTATRGLFVLLAGLLVLSGAGCVGVAAQMIHVIRGNKVPAEFDGLKDQRVAVVCTANATSYDASAASSQLAQMVEILLRQNVKNVTVIPQQKVADWIDNNDWENIDYAQLGKALKAEMIVAIDIDGLRMHEDATMYRGRADVTIRVFDMSKRGSTVFSRTMSNFSYPTQGGVHVSETTIAAFQRLFMTELARDVGRHFYAYDFAENFARD
ncbi:MAG: hypothetical protein RLY70_4381 [Planctomycetota bacterium]|jgi:predicted nucleic acid-binding protein